MHYPKPEVHSPKPEVQPPKPVPAVHSPKPKVQAPKPEVQPPKPVVQPPKPEVQPPKPQVQPRVQPKVISSQKVLPQEKNNEDGSIGASKSKMEITHAAIDNSQFGKIGTTKQDVTGKSHGQTTIDM